MQILKGRKGEGGGGDGGRKGWGVERGNRR